MDLPQTLLAVHLILFVEPRQVEQAAGSLKLEIYQSHQLESASPRHRLAQQRDLPDLPFERTSTADCAANHYRLCAARSDNECPTQCHSD